MVGEIGGNDYNYAFGMNSPQPNGGLNNIGRMITGAVESLALVPLVVKSITGAAKELLDMGATRMGIRELRQLYPSATIAYADYFSAYVQMLRGASKRGFGAAAATKACCGAGGGAYNFDMDRICGAPGTAVCARPEEHLSWDGVHLTQHAYKVMTELLYHRGLASPAPEDSSTMSAAPLGKVPCLEKLVVEDGVGPGAATGE
uniref:GDSL esterase/lipase n=1 Tax=Aegilops tauschii TaxID=37682 RepID=N1R0R5_AEGTA